MQHHLEHKLRDDAVESGPLVMKTRPLLPGAERSKVFHSFWHDISVKSHYNASFATRDRLDVDPGRWQVGDAARR